MKRKIIILILLLGISYSAGAQKLSLSTNLVDWANFGTANIEAGVSISQHFSAMLGGHFNPWKFKTGSGNDIFNKQTTGYVGVKYWPWYVYSGWWLGTKVQYASISRSGIWRPALEERSSIGAGLSFGYTVMLNKNLNLEFGAGVWGGKHLKYAIYECPKCMRLREQRSFNFIHPDDISISLTYVF